MAERPLAKEELAQVAAAARAAKSGKIVVFAKWRDYISVAGLISGVEVRGVGWAVEGEGPLQWKTIGWRIGDDDLERFVAQVVNGFNEAVNPPRAVIERSDGGVERTRSIQ